MVIYVTHDPLTLTFAALADPTRRAIVERLCSDGMKVAAGYSGNDAAAEDLKRAGLEPWLDVWCLTPGGRWQDELAQGLHER